MDQLVRRGMDVVNCCPLCSIGPETAMHWFKNCSYARLFWAMSPLPYSLVATDFTHMELWITVVKGKTNAEEFEFFVCGCQDLWNNRNKQVHEHFNYDAADSIQFVQQYLLRFKEAHPQFSHPRPPEDVTGWIPPPVGTYKANYDASIHVDPDFAGLGLVIRRCNI